MELKEIEMIRQCVDLDRKPFSYFKDRYAFWLIAQKLAHYENSQLCMAEIKKSDFGFLLNKKEVKHFSANLKGKILSSNQLVSYWPSTYFDFEWELGTWGEFISRHRKDAWLQTSRPGFNLVLRLNFSLQHDISYYNLLKPIEKIGPFGSDSHPISKKRNTLAWARLDIDLNENELLIEEIQTDWLREAKTFLDIFQEMEQKKEDPNTHWAFKEEMQSDFKRFKRYYTQVLNPYYAICYEAMLLSVLDFSLNELGISNIYMHHFDTGNKLKDLTYCKPPKSLYTKLPRSFGFKLTQEPPKIIAEYPYLKKMIRRSKNLRWYNLQL